MQAKWQKRCVGELLEHKAQALMATRLASGIVQLLFNRACMLFFIFPTRDASPPLVLAFSGSVLMIAFNGGA